MRTTSGPCRVQSKICNDQHVAIDIATQLRCRRGVLDLSRWAWPQWRLASELLRMHDAKGTLDVPHAMADDTAAEQVGAHLLCMSLYSILMRICADAATCILEAYQLQARSLNTA